ncbi:MAG: antirestriction protein ArdA [Hydrogenoanaerobacterium sp.]
MRTMLQLIFGENYRNHAFPSGEKELQILCDSLDIPNTAETQLQIATGYDNERVNTLLSGKTVNLDKLNFLAKRLDSFDANELTTFYAAASAEKFEDMDSLINLTFNTHCYSVVSDFSDLNAVGRRMYLTEHGGTSVAEFDSLDGQGYFEKVRADNPTPAITPYGILYRNGNSYEHIYDGRHFPRYEWQDNLGTIILTKDGEQEFLYLPFEPAELNKAMERLDTTDFTACTAELDSDTFNAQMKNIIGSVKNPTAETINSLNYFAKRMQNFGVKEMPFLNTLMNELQPATAQDLDALFDSAYEFELYNGIHSAKDYGRYMICDSGHFEYDENLEEYIDFERYGSQRLKGENGALTNSGYIIYHGYNMELADMLSEIGIEPPPQQAQSLKIYMPLKATTYYEENSYGHMEQSDEEIELSPYDIADFKDEILEAIEENALPEESERGLMSYYGETDSVNAKVKRYDFSVEVVGDELMGVVIAQLNAPLDDRELKTLKETISGQCSDGWGEGFEQREIDCNGKEIYVSFWQSGNWSLQTAAELGIDEPKQEMTMGGM